MIRVVLPAHLRTLARVDGEVKLHVEGPATVRAVLDALEAAYPMLAGTIRDHVTKERRAFLRFFACADDLSHAPPDTPLPEAVVTGSEPFLVVGAMAGGSQAPEEGPSASLSPSAARSTWLARARPRCRMARLAFGSARQAEYASRAARGRRLASGPS